jgi:tetratricopeptide (TPR) repeat protein
MTRLTLCTIARNEEASLPACLASVEGVVDDVVVVDTGSTDRTAAVAEAAGARVVHHAWDDDFAAARNAALEHVREGYVLVLDADERLAPGAGPALRAAVEAGALDLGRLPLHDASAEDATPAEVLSGAARRGPPLLLGRLLRRTPDLRWQGCVHEHVTAWATQGRRIGTVEAPIVHYGAVPEVRERLGKSERNLRLLRRACEREPDNAVLKTYLAQDLLHAGQRERAAAAVDEAWRLLAALHEAGRPAPDAVPTGSLRAFLLLGAERLDEALRTLERARTWSGPHPNLDLLQAVHAERSWFAAGVGDPASPLLESAAEACRRCLERAADAFTSPVMPGATGWAAATRLGTVRLLQGRAEAAREAFELALEERPAHLDARLGRVEALVFEGRGAEALNAVEPLLHPMNPDGWILAAVAGFQVGSYADVAALVEQGRRALAAGELVGPHRRWFLEELEAQAPLNESA